VGTDGSRIRAVLFDLGGTLVDERDFAGWAELARSVLLDLTPDDLAHAYAEVEEEVDRDTQTTREAPELLIERYWSRILTLASGRPVGPETAARFVEARRASEREQPLPVYSDVRRCLDRLEAEHRRLGVVSNSSSEARVRRILDQAGIVRYFEKVVSSGTEGVRKPDPEIFRRAVARMEVAPSEALYVGNLRRTDALGARGAGLHSVWLNRDGTGLGDDPPEITSLLEVPLVVRQLEAAPEPSASARVK
jgi:HAD superfamily hydrolase (TIGR01509 family)